MPLVEVRQETSLTMKLAEHGLPRRGVIGVGDEDLEDHDGEGFTRVVVDLLDLGEGVRLLDVSGQLTGEERDEFFELVDMPTQAKLVDMHCEIGVKALEEDVGVRELSLEGLPCERSQTFRRNFQNEFASKPSDGVFADSLSQCNGVHAGEHVANSGVEINGVTASAGAPVLEGFVAHLDAMRLAIHSETHLAARDKLVVADALRFGQDSAEGKNSTP